MSAAILATAGFEAMLSAYLSGSQATVHLYTNDPALTGDRVAADYIAPAYFAYAPVAVKYWTPPALRAGKAFSVCDPVRFVWGAGAAPLPIRGYYVTSGPGGPLLWAWRRPGAAFAMGPGNATLSIFITLYFPPL